MDEIDVAGLRIAYARAGKGPPLLLLHAGVSDSRVWRRQLDELSDEFTVVAWDAPGCGRSSDPPETFRMPDYADCLAALVDALGLGRAHGVGPAPPPAEVVEQRLQQWLREADLPPAQWVPGWIPGLLTEAAPAELIDEVVAITSDVRPAGYRAMAYALAEADLRDVLPPIDVPTLLLYGDARGHARSRSLEQHGGARDLQYRGAQLPSVESELTCSLPVGCSNAGS